MDLFAREPIHITVPGSPDDPRTRVDAPPGEVFSNAERRGMLGLDAVRDARKGTDPFLARGL